MAQWFKEWWSWLWDNKAWCPRIDCGDFPGWLVDAHVWSDKALAWELRLLPIGFFVLWTAYRRRSRFSWFLLVFAAFILVCGEGHEIDSWSFTAPTYRLWGFVKVGMAILGGLACFSMAVCFTKLMRLRTAEEYQAELKRRTKELREALDLTNLVLDNAADGMFLLDMTCGITYANPRAEQMFGWSSIELLGQNLHDLIHHHYPDGRPYPITDCPLDRIYALECAIQKEDHKDIFWHRDGHSIPVLCNIIPVFKDGSMVGAVLSVRDMTHIDEWSQKQATMLDNAGSAMYIIDEDHKIVSANRRAVELFGFTQEEMHGKSIHQLIHHTHADGSPFPTDQCPLFHAVLRDESLTDAEDCFWTKDGRPVYSACSLAPLYKDGQRSGSVFSIRDITTDKQIEEHKTAFLLMLAHELRNPLNAIVQGVELIFRHAGPEFDDMAGEMINRQVSHMAHMIDDILEAAHLTKGSIKIERQQVCVHDVLKSALESTQSKIDESGNVLHVTDVPADDVCFEGDEVRITQVITNLLTNSAKYTDRGEIFLEIHDEGQHVSFSVRDTGQGIGPNEIPHIFNTFYQSDRSLARSKGGLGLGLTLVKKIVDMHDGMIQIESEVQKGTTFTIRIPKESGGGEAIQLGEIVRGPAPLSKEDHDVEHPQAKPPL